MTKTHQVLEKLTKLEGFKKTKRRNCWNLEQTKYHGWRNYMDNCKDLRDMETAIVAITSKLKHQVPEEL